MDLLLIGLCFAVVITLYFKTNPLSHSRRFMFRRFVNWFPLGMTYAFLYMARYNLNVSKNALGSAMTKSDFGLIFGAGTIVYGCSFLLNGPLVDKIGGKKGIIIAALGACLANIAMGLATYLYLHQRLQANLTLVFACLYSINMFFQSYGAVSIIKVKAYWFHVRERGVFGAIFGTLISFGVYFAFDWGQAIVNASKAHIEGEPSLLQKIFRVLFATDTGNTDAIWLVFFLPATILIFWALIDMWLIKDTPGEANFEDFDTHDASSGEMDRNFTIPQLLHRIFSSRLMLLFAAIEFTSGVLRNGILQWYTIYAKELPQAGSAFFFNNWGLLVCFAGIIGGFSGGLLSDRIFHSRRGPPVAILNGIMFVCSILMIVSVYSSPTLMGMAALSISCAVIGVHSLMSGTAAADFGGRKATATASGIVDGFVYLGSGLQSVSLGYLTTKDWQFWPIFLLPFTVIGCLLAIRIWKDLPEATRKYLQQVENVSIEKGQSNASIPPYGHKLESLQPKKT
jgi:OPA family glycerol-3-phosphate transporter-like MFS transporter